MSHYLEEVAFNESRAPALRAADEFLSSHGTLVAGRHGGEVEDLHAPHEPPLADHEDHRAAEEHPLAFVRFEFGC